MQLMQSVAFSSFVRRGAILLTIAFPEVLRAEEAGPVVDAPSSGSGAPPAENVGSTPQGESFGLQSQGALGASAVRSRVSIVTVGRALSPSSLERVLGPALRSSFDLEFASTQSFAPEDLFRSRVGAPAGIHVWVDTTAERNVRIYFKSRDGTRYLVRDLESSGALGEMDREAIAQAIEWSLQALAEGTVGMTREEAEELLSESETLPARKAKALPMESPWRRKAKGWLPEVALLYRFAPFSPELLATQGPALRVGADKVSGNRQWGLAAGLHHQAPRRYTEEGIALEIQTVGVRIDGRYLRTDLFKSSGLGPRFGLGVDAVFVSPEIIDQSRFEGAKNARNISPVLDGGFVWQVRVESGVRLEMSAGIEVDLITLHYELATAGESRVLVSRFPVRPSLSVGVALF